MNSKLFAISAIGLFLLGTGLSAQIPQLINCQGRVAANGTGFTGAGRFKFALVSGGGGGANVSFCSKDGTGADGSQPLNAVSRPVAKGLLNVLLADTSLSNMTVIPATVFGDTAIERASKPLELAVLRRNAKNRLNLCARPVDLKFCP